MKQDLINIRFEKFSRKFIFFLVLLINALLFSLEAIAGTDSGEEFQQPISTAVQEVVKGIILDENGIPLPGASVFEEGTSNGTVTNFDGEFQLTVLDPDAVLVINYLGYVEQRIAANQEDILVQMEPDAATLNEVVVVGYGTAARKDVTGAVSSISEDDLNEGAMTNPLQQLVGKAAGVKITQTGSEPGSSPSIRIRGITSLIGGNDPLVVVDGIQGNMDLLNQISPSEIASVDILKDASATAIYGSRGAPGVIIITTKKNKAGRSDVEFSSIASFDYIPKELDMLNADQWWEQAQKFEVPASTNHGSNTDWFDILTQRGVTQNYSLAFGGGAENFSYRASVSAILQEGVVINSDNQKYIARITATQRALDDRLELTMNLNSGINETQSSVQSIGRAAFTSNLISNAYMMRPTDPVYNVDGSYYTDPNVFQYFNPYAVAETVVNEGKNNNLFGSLNAELELLPELTATWFGSWRKTDNTIGFFLPVKSTVAAAIDQEGFANINNNRQDEKLMNMSLNYKAQLDVHQFDVLALYEWQKQAYQGNYLQARGFFNDIATYNALQLGDISSVQPGDISSYKNDRTLVSFLGRINYSLLDKYLLTVSYRRDGSSVFGKNHKWGDFPAIAAAWKIDEEAFVDGAEWLDQLKLRAGYGVTGNQQGLYPQNSLSLVGAAGVTYFGGEPITNFNITQNANEDIRWETKKQANVGIDFALWDFRLTGSFDAFTATTDNLLFNYTVPQPPFPFGSIIANVGSLRNSGLEATLSYELIRSEDLTLTLAGNASFLDNEILNLSGSINGVPLNTDYVPWGPNSFLIEGKPIGTFNILQHTGKDESNSETVLDRNGDGTIDQGIRSPDRKLEGSALPTYTVAFNPSVQYKDFDLSMVWRASGGNKIYNGIRQSLSYMENLGKSNVLESAVPLGLFTSQYGSDLWLEDGDFIRLENVTAGYSFQPEHKHIESVRLSITGRNLLLFTEYSGLDPELNMSGGNGFGGDNGIYPRTRSVALGLNVKFN